MMDIGETIKPMDSGSTLTLTVLNMRDIGLRTSSTVREKNIGQTVPSTKETTNSERKMVLVNSTGQTSHPTVVILSITIFMGMESTDGLTGENIVGIGQ
jgi:hypothetical protein